MGPLNKWSQTSKISHRFQAVASKLELWCREWQKTLLSRSPTLADFVKARSKRRMRGLSKEERDAQRQE